MTIPVTSFAGKTVAVFGLGGSGLASCHALKAGGAEVIAGDDSADNIANAAQAGFITADLRKVSWANFAALVLTPGAPLTHPAPHWTVLAARAGRRRSDRRYRIVLPRTPPSCAGRAVRRHHRHQRQIDHHGTDRASDARRRLRHPDGRQYRHRDPVAGAAAHGARPRHRDVVVSDRSGADPRSYRRHPAQCQRRPHRSPRHARALCRGEGAAGRRRAERGHRDRRRRRRLEPQRRRPHRASRPARGPGLGEKSAGRRRLCRARNHRARLPAARAARSRGSAASVRCAACTTRRTRRAPRPARWRSVSASETLQMGLRSFPGLAHRMEQVGRRGNVLFVNDSKGTNADAAAHALSSFADIFWIAGGKPKLGGITGLSEYFPRIRKAYLIGEAAPEFAGTLEGRCPRDFARRSMSRWPMPRATPKPPAWPMRWCCCRRPAPRSTSTAISKSAAPGSATSSLRCPASSRWYEEGGRVSAAFASISKLSSPAKAGDPVFQSVQYSCTAVITGYSAFAECDGLGWRNAIATRSAMIRSNPQRYSFH